MSFDKLDIYKFWKEGIAECLLERSSERRGKASRKIEK
jgi:hypothetical protein